MNRTGFPHRNKGYFEKKNILCEKMSFFLLKPDFLRAMVIHSNRYEAPYNVFVWQKRNRRVTACTLIRRYVLKFYQIYKIS